LLAITGVSGWFPEGTVSELFPAGDGKQSVTGKIKRPKMDTGFGADAVAGTFPKPSTARQQVRDYRQAANAEEEYWWQVELAREEAAKKAREQPYIDAEIAATKSAKEIADAQEKEAKRSQQAWENFTGNVQRNMGDVLYKSVTDGFSGIGDAFKQMTLRMMADAAAANLTQYLFGDKQGGGALGAFGGNIMSFFGGKSYAGGGFTGSGSRSGGVDGMGGFPAILHPNETVIDHTRGGGASQPSVTVVQNINIDSRSDQSTIMASMQRAAQMAESSIMNSLQRGGVFAQAVGRA
jgi:hypothetical protein